MAKFQQLDRMPPLPAAEKGSRSGSLFACAPPGQLNGPMLSTTLDQHDHQEAAPAIGRVSTHFGKAAEWQVLTVATQSGPVRQRRLSRSEKTALLPFVGDAPVSASKMLILDRLPNSRVARDRLDRRLTRQMRHLLPRIAAAHAVGGPVSILDREHPPGLMSARPGNAGTGGEP